MKKIYSDTLTVAAVVVTYNRKDLLRKCIHSLVGQTRVIDEIFVIDNASTDGTDALICLEFPHLTYKKLSENCGGSGGFREGIKLAYEKGYDCIWVMDDDVVPSINALQTLLNYASIDKETVCLVPRRLDVNGMSISQEGRIVVDIDSPCIFEYPDLLFKEYTQINKITFEGPIFWRKGIQRIGLPDAKYFILFDDVDYGYRLSQIGNIYYIRDAIIEKMLPIDFSFTDQNQWKWYYFWRNLIYFTRKNLRKNAIRKLFYWLINDEDIQFILKDIGRFDWSKIKFIFVFILAVWNSFGKMGKKYLPGQIVI